MSFDKIFLSFMSKMHNLTIILPKLKNRQKRATFAEGSITIFLTFDAGNCHHDLKNVYLLICHVPFPAQGAGFFLQCTKCSRQASLVQRCC